MTERRLTRSSYNWRAHFLLFLMLICVAVIIWKIGVLHITERDFLQGQGDARTIRTVPLVASRGLITDRNGEPLAVSTPVQSIWVDPGTLVETPAAVNQLAQVLDLDPVALADSINGNAHREFMYVKRGLPPAEAERVMALDLGGVYSQQEYRRFYPQGEAAAHLVGFSDVDDVGQEGLELTYNDWLQGMPGRRQVMKDRRGNIIEELNILEPAQPGKNLELSIDFRIQNLAYRELKAEFIKRRAKGASAVVLDVRTGEVLAMVNQPSYNPNNRGSLTEFGALRNRAVTDVVEPGSTIKPFTIIAALESGRFEPETNIETSPGWMMIGRNEVRDLKDYGTLTLAEVITKSSNIGTSKIAMEIGPEPILDVLERAGFGQITATGFPGERGGVLPGPARWSRIEIATLSYGYGLSASALQLAQAYATIAHDGIRKPVSLLKIGAESAESIEGQRVFGQDITRRVQAMLGSVVDSEQGGAATDANIPFYSVAGKTGTAHVVGEFGYEDDLHNSLFAGFVPASDPRLVIVVIVNEPKGDEHYGGQVAAPVFSKIAAGAMRILNVTPDRIMESKPREISSL